MDGIYCKFCVCHTARGTSQSGSGAFISEPFTGTWPDALAQHAASDRHGASALSFRQIAEWLVVCKQLEDLVAEVQVVSIDGEAFLDAMCYLYFLLKQEIPHTTNFVSLRELAILHGLRVMWNSANRQTMLAAYPLIASLLARIAVLSASSAEVERVFLL